MVGAQKMQLVGRERNRAQCANRSLVAWGRLGWKEISVLRLVPVDTQSWGEWGEEAGRVAGTWQGDGDCPGHVSACILHPQNSRDRLSCFPDPPGVIPD